MLCVLSRVWLCGPRDCHPPGSSVHGIFQERIQEWVATSYSRGSSWPRNQTHVSWVSFIGRLLLYHWHHLGSPIMVYVVFTDHQISASVFTFNGAITLLCPPVHVWCWFKVVLTLKSGWHTHFLLPRRACVALQQAASWRFGGIDPWTCLGLVLPCEKTLHPQLSNELRGTILWALWSFLDITVSVMVFSNCPHPNWMGRFTIFKMPFYYLTPDVSIRSLVPIWFLFPCGFLSLFLRIFSSWFSYILLYCVSCLSPPVWHSAGPFNLCSFISYSGSLAP